MNSASLYDFGPVLYVMGIGLMVALVPLAWVLLRSRDASSAQRMQALTLSTLFLTFDLVLFGAFTRLTDSGLGCPDWPGCYGQASPSGAREAIALAQEAMPTGPVTHGKAWIEMIHRYLATAVGVLIVVMVVGSWRQWRHERRTAHAVHPGWAVATLLWVSLQGYFGAATVTMKLFPAVVTLHLLGGVGLLALLAVQAELYRQAAGRAVEPVSSGVRTLLWVTSVVVAVQIVLGGWVSANYAVLACDTFPMCQGSWWPSMDFSQGFEWWRPLGQSADGSPLEFPALTAIHYVHRLFAVGVLLAIGVLVWCLWRAQHLARQRRALVLLSVAQLVTGLTNVVLGWPLLAAVLHTGGAALLMTVLVWALCASRVQEAIWPVPHVGGRELRGGA